MQYKVGDFKSFTPTGNVSSISVVGYFPGNSQRCRQGVNILDSPF